MKYVKSLDGMRGIAVIAVVLFHFGYFGAGWIGVQMFFTLSGYLITSILLEDRDRPFTSYIGRFYWRRTLRIFPLYFGFLLVSALSFALLGIPGSFAHDWGYLITYLANFARLRASDVGPSFTHLWSLAVEEQFYVLWPMTLFVLSPRVFRWVVVGVIAFSPLLRLAVFQALLGTGQGEEYAGKAVYVLPFTQFDAFAAGAAIPIFGLDKMRRAGAWFVGLASVAATLGLSFLVYDHFWGGGAFYQAFGYPMYLVPKYQYVWGYSLLNLIAALGIICLLRNNWPSRWLEVPFLVHIGKISYGVYVFHVPVLLAFEHLQNTVFGQLGGVSRFLLFLGYAATTVGIAEASFRWFETPFLRMKDLLGRSRVRTSTATPPPPRDSGSGTLTHAS